jgi:threonine dehydratase
MTDAQLNLREMLNVIRPTTIIEAPQLSARLGAHVILASETFQYTGSFKFRAAYSVASRVPQDLLITASSGNFGQALAYACKLLNKSCIVVMPTSSARVKVDSVREHGGRVEPVDTQVKSRAERVKEIANQHPEAYIANAYDDQFVVRGNSTLGAELFALNLDADIIVVPVGGGGLISGIIVGFGHPNRKTCIFGAEPLMANDAARSLRCGKIVRNEQEPQTIADGARTLSLGLLNWEIMRKSISTIVEVPEEQINTAVNLLFHFANLKVEPTGALSVAAVLSQPAMFRERTVCCVVSGGNVDPSLYARLLVP